MFSMLEGMTVLLCWRFLSSIVRHTFSVSVLMLLVVLYPTSLSFLNSELICGSYDSSGFIVTPVVFSAK